MTEELVIHGHSTGAVEGFKELDKEHGLVFRAQDIQRERTGIHARLSLLFLNSDGEKELAWTRCNIERDEERVRLSNAAWHILEPALRPWQAEEAKGGKDLRLVYKHDLDTFCARLWETFIAANLPEETEGKEGRIGHVLYPYVIEGGGTILFGPPGRGKSYMGMIMAQSVNAGLEEYWKVKRAKAFLVNLERSKQSVELRLAKINKALGLSSSQRLLCLHRRGKSLVEVREVVEAAILKYKVGFLVLDSISRAGAGLDLNDNKSVNAIIDILNGFGVPWLALAHSPRASDSHIFGGIHFEAGADIVIRLTSEEREDALGIGLQITKSNDTAKGGIASYRLSFGIDGLEGFSRAKDSDFPTLRASRIKGQAESIREYLLDNDEATGAQISLALGINRGDVSSVLNHDPQFTLAKKEGREKFFKVSAEP